MIRWLTISKFAAESGYSEKAIRRKIEDRIWQEGVIWRKAPDGRIMINTEGYEEWVVQGGVLNRPQSRVSKSPSPTKASVVGSASRCLLQPLT